MGHSFGGQHWDYYATNPLYTCDAAVGDDAHRVLRNGAYKYLEDDLYVTQCAVASIVNTIPNFGCMWDENATPHVGYITVYTVCLLPIHIIFYFYLFLFLFLFLH
jgi:hypothetical protein